jgi:hypothetical protein
MISGQFLQMPSCLIVVGNGEGRIDLRGTFLPMHASTTCHPRLLSSVNDPPDARSIWCGLVHRALRQSA